MRPKVMKHGLLINMPTQASSPHLMFARAQVSAKGKKKNKKR